MVRKRCTRERFAVLRSPGRQVPNPHVPSIASEVASPRPDHQDPARNFSYTLVKQRPMARPQRLISILCAGAVGLAIVFLLPPRGWYGTPVLPGVLEGTVRTDLGGQPMAGVWVATQLDITQTDSLGQYRVMVDAAPDTVLFSARGYQTSSSAVRWGRKRPRRIDACLVRAPTEPTPLDGKWEARFVLAAGFAGDTIRARTVGGILEFADSIPNHRGPSQEDDWRLFGRTDVDFTPFLGGPVGPFKESRSVFGPVDDSFWTELEAGLPSDDSVWVYFVPRISHGAVTLEGRVRGDTIRGTWYVREYCCRGVQNGSCCGPFGTVILSRVR